MKTKTAQHTPGPWIVHEKANYAGGNETAWDVVSGPTKTFHKKPIPIASCGLHQDAEANARLIAAAPALLEAAKEALYLLRSLTGDAEIGTDCHKGKNMLRAAIAKAEKEEAKEMATVPKPVRACGCASNDDAENCADLDEHEKWVKP